MMYPSESDTRPSESSAWFSFMMGEFEAKFPRDRSYVTNHMWAKKRDAGGWSFGLTAYAVRLLQDVYFLDWLVEPKSHLVVRQNLGSIESKKAESDLFAPAAGHLIDLNEKVLSDPSLINADPYGDGWMLAIQIETEDGLLSPDEYLLHLEKAWDVAQKTIKGQANH